MFYTYILWHTEPFLGNDRDYTGRNKWVVLWRTTYGDSMIVAQLGAKFRNFMETEYSLPVPEPEESNQHPQRLFIYESGQFK
jgi:hypothetical protein